MDKVFQESKELVPITHKEFNEFIKGKGFTGRNKYKLKGLKAMFGFKPMITGSPVTISSNGLRRLGFNIPVGHITAWQAVMLNKAAKELPSESDITKADDIELQEIAEKTPGIISQIKDVQTDTEDLFEHPLRELLGLDKQLRTVRGSLKVEVAKMVELEEHITKERRKLEEFREYPGEYDDAMKEDITKRIDALNNELATRQESTDLLKGRLKNQITSFCETIAKVLDKDTSLGEKIRTLFREQGITIASILRAIGMAIGVLVEALLSSGGGANTGGVSSHLLKMRKV